MFSKLSFAIFALSIVNVVSAAGWSVVRPYRDALVSQFNDLNSAIAAVPSTNATAEQTTAIVDKLNNLSKSLDFASTLYNNTLATAGPPTIVDSTDGCGNNAVKPGVEALNTIAAKKDAFVATGTTDLIKNALTTFNASSYTFTEVWLEVAPAPLKPLPVAAKASIGTALTNLFEKYN